MLAAPAARAEIGCFKVMTQSQKVICNVAMTSVKCITASGVGGFTNAPDDGIPQYAHLPYVKADGTFDWDIGTGIGSCDGDFTLTYGVTQFLKGWTIDPTSDGTRFTNNSSGHGMFVSLADVSAF